MGDVCTDGRFDLIERFKANYCYYQDGDKWVAWSSYQGDDVEITPDYWMPIEPPKEVQE